MAKGVCISGSISPWETSNPNSGVGPLRRANDGFVFGVSCFQSRVSGFGLQGLMRTRGSERGSYRALHQVLGEELEERIDRVRHHLRPTQEQPVNQSAPAANTARAPRGSGCFPGFASGQAPPRRTQGAGGHLLALILLRDVNQFARHTVLRPPSI